jgi:hypothetical protein
VKLGSKGSALFIEEEPIQQPAIFAKIVIDMTGAGDTFTAAFAVALVEGKSKKECLRFASMCGRIYFACYLFWNFLFGNMWLTICENFTTIAAAASLCVKSKEPFPVCRIGNLFLNFLIIIEDTCKRSITV